MRWLYLILIVLILALPFALRESLRGQTSSAQITGDSNVPTLVIVTPHNQDIRREFARAFSKWHKEHYGQPAFLDCRSVGGTNDIKRSLASWYSYYRQKDGKLQSVENVSAPYDMVWGGGDFFFNNELKPLGILQPLEKEEVVNAIGKDKDAYVAGSALYDLTKGKPDEPIRWAGVCLSSFGIVYNPDVMRALGLAMPTQWKDLSVPQLSGAVALADPTHSGSAAVAYVMVLQRAMADAEDAFFAAESNAALKVIPRDKWPAANGAAYQQAIARGWKTGMQTMLLIAANSRYFTDSAERVPTDVGNGDAAAGMAIDFYGRVEEQIVGPDRARFIAPKAATATSCDPIAILYGTCGDKLELANRFIKFLLSREGQLVWIKKPGTPDGPALRGLGRPPILRELYTDQTDWMDNVNPFQDAGSFNQRGEWMATFTEVRPVWAAAWIDDRDALHAAYQQILGVSDQTLREQLLAELADLPIEYTDLLAEHAAWSLAKAKTDTERDKVLKPLASLNIDAEKVKQRADLIAAADKTQSTGVVTGLSRTEWSSRFRDHYARVAAKAH